MTPIFTFWSFTPMTWLERLCLTSWVAAGHPVDLYTYDEIQNVPDGVHLRNAADIVPREHVFQHHSGSWATFSDVFRYHCLQRGLGIWCDADVFLLRSIDDLGDYILAWESTVRICNAVLRLPPDEPFLKQMLKVATANVPIPPHWPFIKKMKQRARSLFGAHKPLSQLQRTVIGPQALTHYARQYQIPVLPRDVLNPTRPVVSEAILPFSPGFCLEDIFTAETRALHLWNGMIADRKALPPPAGSFLARMCEKHGIDPSSRIASIPEHRASAV